jgi:2-keto-4-pentenoate hydratase/2-oxohepta-3-ene-1,7-dioic acid hydratase in catechol pathway
MKLVTFRSDDKTSAGILISDDKVIDLGIGGHGRPRYSDALAVIAAGPEAWTDLRQFADSDESKVVLSDVQLLAPIWAPRKNIFCVGRNYVRHIEEGARARGIEPTFPKIPEFFSKPTTSVIGPGAQIERHSAHTEQLDYEVELAIVIGKRVRSITVDDALGAVFGYTIVNDISARDAQVGHGQWFKGKAFDTFCPMGPCIVTADEFGDPSGHRISLRVSGGIRQDSNTADMLFSVAQIISSLSSGMTLEPGDVIATGTPSGVALGMKPQKWLQVGDIVEATIDGIGTLSNPVVE